MCSACCQVLGWRTHTATLVGPLATLTGDVGKGLLKRSQIKAMMNNQHLQHAHRGVDNTANSSCDSVTSKIAQSLNIAIKK